MVTRNPYRLTGLENLQTDPLRGIKLPVRSRYTPYQEVDEEGNVQFVQKMPESYKRIRYMLLHAREYGFTPEYEQALMQNPEIKLIMPEWFGGALPSKEEYPDIYKPPKEYLPGWVRPSSQNPAPPGSNYEVWGQTRGQWGADNPYYPGEQALREQYGTGGANFPGPRGQFPGVGAQPGAYYGTRKEWEEQAIQGRITGDLSGMWREYQAANPPPVTTITAVNPDLEDEDSAIATLSTGERVKVSVEEVAGWQPKTIRPSTKAVKAVPPGAIYLGEVEGQPQYIERSQVKPLDESVELGTAESLPILEPTPYVEPDIPVGIEPSLEAALKASKAEAARIQRMKVLFARVYPLGADTDEAIKWLKASPDNVGQFLAYIQSVGPNEDTVGLLVELFPKISQEQVNALFEAYPREPVPVDQEKAQAPPFAQDEVQVGITPPELEGNVAKVPTTDQYNQAYFAEKGWDYDFKKVSLSKPSEQASLQNEYNKRLAEATQAYRDKYGDEAFVRSGSARLVELVASPFWSKKYIQPTAEEPTGLEKAFAGLDIAMFLPLGAIFKAGKFLPKAWNAAKAADKAAMVKAAGLADDVAKKAGTELTEDEIKFLQEGLVKAEAAKKVPKAPEVPKAEIKPIPEAKPTLQMVSPKTPSAKVESVKGLEDSFKISTPDGAKINGMIRNASFEGKGISPSRGELFMAEVPETMQRQGLGTSLSADALRLMKANNTETVKVFATTEGGKASLAKLIRGGYLSKPIARSEAGATEHTILLKGTRAKKPTPTAAISGQGVEAAGVKEATVVKPPAAEVPPAKPLEPPSPVAALNPPELPPENILGNLQNADELVTVMTKPDVYRKIANLPGIKQIVSILNPSGVARTVPEKAVVARAALREEGANKAIGAFSRLQSLGAKEQIWGKLDDAQRLTEGKLSGKTLDEVLTYRAKYAGDMTPQQKQWAETFHELEADKLRLLKDNGIEINELAFQEGGEYVGRRVVGRIDEATGELAESAFVGSPGPGRPGSRMGAEKPRYFKDIKEAIDEGYRYLPPDEALFLNLKGAYNRIADKEMAEWVLDRIAYRTTGAPEELVIAALDARTKLWNARRLEAALNRAVRGERLPDSTIAGIAESFPDEAKRLKGLIPDLQAGNPVADQVQALTRDAKTLVSQNEVASLKAVTARAKAREAAMSSHLGEATVQSPAFAGKILTGPEARETANVLNKAFLGQYGDLDRIITGVNKLNAIGRYFALAADASPLLIQLIAFPARFPKVWGKSAANFAKALFSEASQAKYIAANNDIIQKSRNLILTKGGQTEYTEAFRSGGIMQSRLAKYPRKVLEPFQRGFEAALDTAGIELRKSFAHMATTPQRTAEIEQFINIIRGVTSSGRIGVSPAIRAAETAAFLAPRYNRATFALVSDIARGGIRGDQARKAIFSLIGAGAAMGTGITLARGEGWQKVADHLDITNAREFMTWEVAGQRVGPGSKMRSLAVLLGKVIKDPESAAKYATDFLRGNFAPVVSTSADVLIGEDYVGQPTRPGKRLGGFPSEKGTPLGEGLLGLSRRVLAENLLPIWVQSTVLESSDLMGRMTRGAAEFFGARAYPEKDWEEDYRKLGLPVTDGFSVISRFTETYEPSDLYSDTARKLKGIPADKILRSKEYPEHVKSIIKAREVEKILDQIPNGKLKDINADPGKGPTFQDYYEEWQKGLKIKDEDEAAEWNKKYRIGNMRPDEYALLWEYHNLPKEERPEFEKAHPEIGKNPYEEWLKGHPDENALLAVHGQVKVLTKAAYDKAMALASDLGFPLGALEKYLPPKEVAKPYFELQDTAEKFGANSWESQLILAENEKLTKYLKRDMPDKPVAALKLLVKNRENKELYDSYSDRDSPNFIATAKGREEAREKLKKDKPEYADDLRRIEAIEKGAKDEAVIKSYVEYSQKVDKWGAGSAESKLHRFEDTDLERFGQEKLKWTPVEVKSPDALKLQVKWRDTQEKFDAIRATTAADFETKRNNFLKQNPQFARDRDKIEAYNKGLTGNVVDTYAEYYGKPRKGYEDDWFLIENPAFYQAMTTLKDNPWKPRDFSKVPSKAVFALYQQYLRLPDNARTKDAFRRAYPNLDAWMIFAMGYKPMRVANPMSSQYVAQARARSQQVSARQPAVRQYQPSSPVTRTPMPYRVSGKASSAARRVGVLR